MPDFLLGLLRTCQSVFTFDCYNFITIHSGCVIIMHPELCIFAPIYYFYCYNMKPIDFPQSTKTLTAPSSLAGNCDSLPVWSDSKRCVSCWKPSIKERLRILVGGNIYLGVLSGKTQPPVFLLAKTPFVQEPIKSRVADFFVRLGQSISRAAKSVWNALKSPDKRKHLLYGFIISLVVGICCPWAAMPCFGLAVGCIAGALKEWWDSEGHGTVETMDFVCTCVGAFLALPFSFIVQSLIW